MQCSLFNSEPFRLALRPAVLVVVALVTMSGQTSSYPIYAAAQGVICDGKSHHLGAKFATLSAAQAVYPFVTSLSQEIDYAAIKLTSNMALGGDGSEHGTNTALNRPIILPAGSCQFGNDTWVIRNADGIQISGQGKTATVLQSNNTVLRFDGLWYSTIQDLEMDTLTKSGTAAFELDGNVPRHPYPTRGEQGVLVQNVLVTGGGSTYAMAVCRQGGSRGQCSENTYISLHLQNASFATYYQNGFNALDNIWLGGDAQNYLRNGVYLVAGSIGIYKVSFESTTGYTQIQNDGWDINAASAGAYDGIVVDGCRSESLRFYNGGWAQLASIRAFTHTPAYFSRSASSAVPQYSATAQTGADGFSHMYVATTGGRSAATPPAWPSTGAVRDGTVVWTMTPYTVINLSNGNGSVDLTTSHLDPAATFVGIGSNDYLHHVEIHGVSYKVSPKDSLIMVDPTANAVTINLPQSDNPGHRVVVRRETVSANPVTLSKVITLDNELVTVTLPPNTASSATVVYGAGGQRASEWFMTNYSLGPCSHLATVDSVCGVASLSLGRATVSVAAIGALTSSTAAGFAVSLTHHICSTHCGVLSLAAVTPGRSFVINSSDPMDSSDVFWELHYIQ